MRNVSTRTMVSTPRASTSTAVLETTMGTWSAGEFYMSCFRRGPKLIDSTMTSSNYGNSCSGCQIGGSVLECSDCVTSSGSPHSTSLDLSETSMSFSPNQII